MSRKRNHMVKKQALSITEKVKKQCKIVDDLIKNRKQFDYKIGSKEEEECRELEFEQNLKLEKAMIKLRSLERKQEKEKLEKKFTPELNPVMSEEYKEETKEIFKNRKY